ncbi:ATP-binding protein [Streptomyces sp. NBC_00859]|uniref:ATP-binding protein n=1 Tax=Streptomyces sp. NBC_00859 TaxID=2903682 RepID=UPI003865E5DB|nr:ATP-binding protein [Streptomyces sp. NBC_00859]
MDSPLADSATARDVASRFLSQHCPWADVDAVLLVITELVANAARHTAGWWRLRLSTEAEVLVVEMDDASPAHPVAREPDFSGGGGFGWHMVLRLAGQVEVRPRPCGKTVRAVWSRPVAGPAVG